MICDAQSRGSVAYSTSAYLHATARAFYSDFDLRSVHLGSHVIRILAVKATRFANATPVPQKQSDTSPTKFMPTQKLRELTYQAVNMCQTIRVAWYPKEQSKLSSQSIFSTNLEPNRSIGLLHRVIFQHASSAPVLLFL